MTRQDHKYVNLPRSLVEVIDACVTGILRNGTQIYANRKDFVIKSVVQQIENEKTTNPNLSKKIHKINLIEQQATAGGGNRPKNAY